MNKRILVLTPTLGARHTLHQTVESVREIGGEFVKHVIITPEENAEKIKLQYPKLEVLIEPNNKKGIYPSLNYGFEKLGRDYEYLTFINDDDYWLASFKDLIQTVTNDNTIDMVYGKVMFVDENGMCIKKQTSSKQFYNFLSLMHSNIVLFTQQSTLVRSDMFFKIGGFSENYKLISDSKFWIDLSLLKPKFKYIPRECAAYRLQEGQLSSDSCLQSTEHGNLMKSYEPINKFIKFFDMFLFRIMNWHIYLNRKLKV